MKDKILQILEKHSTPFLEGKAVHWSNWDKVAEEIVGSKSGNKEVEQEYLAMFNRIKKAMCEKRGKKFSPARTVSKPSQLHARLKDYTLEEIGKAVYNAFNDQYHIETNWRFITTEFICRADKLEKFLNQ